MPVVKRKRMFRGNARGKVFQTVDLGAGKGEYIERQAQKFPKRKYAAVDFLFGHVNFFNSDRRRLHAHGVIVGTDAREFLDRMIREHRKTRHLNMDMPYPIDTSAYASQSTAAFVHALQVLPKVLLPNGKFYVTSESLFTIEQMQRLAIKKGFSARMRKPIPPIVSPGHRASATSQEEKYPQHYRTQIMRNFAHTALYRLEITYNLKKAFPRKAERKELSTMVNQKARAKKN
jgi:hypothetical protein